MSKNSRNLLLFGLNDDNIISQVTKYLMQYIFEICADQDWSLLMKNMRKQKQRYPTIVRVQELLFGSDTLLSQKVCYESLFLIENEYVKINSLSVEEIRSSNNLVKTCNDILFSKQNKSYHVPVKSLILLVQIIESQNFQPRLYFQFFNSVSQWIEVEDIVLLNEKRNLQKNLIIRAVSISHELVEYQSLIVSDLNNTKLNIMRTKHVKMKHFRNHCVLLATNLAKLQLKYDQTVKQLNQRNTIQHYDLILQNIQEAQRQCTHLNEIKTKIVVGQKQVKRMQKNTVQQGKQNIQNINERLRIISQTQIAVREHDHLLQLKSAKINCLEQIVTCKRAEYNQQQIQYIKHLINKQKDAKNVVDSLQIIKQNMIVVHQYFHNKLNLVLLRQQFIKAVFKMRKQTINQQSQQSSFKLQLTLPKQLLQQNRTNLMKFGTNIALTVLSKDQVQQSLRSIYQSRNADLQQLYSQKDKIKKCYDYINCTMSQVSLKRQKTEILGSIFWTSRQAVHHQKLVFQANHIEKYLKQEEYAVKTEKLNYFAEILERKCTIRSFTKSLEQTLSDQQQNVDILIEKITTEQQNIDTQIIIIEKADQLSENISLLKNSKINRLSQEIVTFQQKLNKIKLVKNVFGDQIGLKTNYINILKKMRHQQIQNLKQIFQQEEVFELHNKIQQKLSEMTKPLRKELIQLQGAIELRSKKVQNIMQQIIERKQGQIQIMQIEQSNLTKISQMIDQTCYLQKQIDEVQLQIPIYDRIHKKIVSCQQDLVTDTEITTFDLKDQLQTINEKLNKAQEYRMYLFKQRLSAYQDALSVLQKQKEYNVQYLQNYEENSIQYRQVLAKRITSQNNLSKYVECVNQFEKISDQVTIKVKGLESEAQELIAFIQSKKQYQRYIQLNQHLKSLKSQQYEKLSCKKQQLIDCTLSSVFCKKYQRILFKFNTSKNDKLCRLKQDLTVLLNQQQEKQNLCEQHQNRVKMSNQNAINFELQRKKRDLQQKQQSQQQVIQYYGNHKEIVQCVAKYTSQVQSQKQIQNKIKLCQQSYSRHKSDIIYQLQQVQAEITEQHSQQSALLQHLTNLSPLIETQKSMKQRLSQMLNSRIMQLKKQMRAQDYVNRVRFQIRSDSSLMQKRLELLRSKLVVKQNRLAECAEIVQKKQLTAEDSCGSSSFLSTPLRRDGSQVSVSSSLRNSFNDSFESSYFRNSSTIMSVSYDQLLLVKQEEVQTAMAELRSAQSNSNNFSAIYDKIYTEKRILQIKKLCTKQGMSQKVAAFAQKLVELRVSRRPRQYKSIEDFQQNEQQSVEQLIREMKAVGRQFCSQTNCPEDHAQGLVDAESALALQKLNPQNLKLVELQIRVQNLRAEVNVIRFVIDYQNGQTPLGFQPLEGLRGLKQELVFKKVDFDAVLLRIETHVKQQLGKLCQIVLKHHFGTTEQFRIRAVSVNDLTDAVFEYLRLNYSEMRSDVERTALGSLDVPELMNVTLIAGSARDLIGRAVLWSIIE